MHTHTLTHRPFLFAKEAHAVNPWLFKRLFLNKMLPHRLADIYLIDDSRFHSTPSTYFSLLSSPSLHPFNRKY
ncbi:hypothetical protein BDB00DRAFT_810068 [Zychaea mexicana]|uniref:uncharacterized protein n=2 Tax=Zychaea mexicana TaxID=64656 RepID=UPI0022FF0158|nr:uncharacterized protein BDB00DRAFT_810068 [Zychaea mexicana]KAI9496349.1 hypothetical protein BDB00DRAFT_810068 [Zychaea mexicana]